MSNPPHECFISVDVEAAGPIPGVYSLLSIGACLADDDTVAFECLLKPISKEADPKALAVSGLSLDELKRRGLEPGEAMRRFGSWVGQVAVGRTPVFVGLNASFDWSFGTITSTATWARTRSASRRSTSRRCTWARPVPPGSSPSQAGWRKF